MGEIIVENFAQLPAPGTPGRIARLTGGVCGLWMDQGTEWVPVNGGIANVRDFGAKQDGITNDKDAYNAAIQALSAGGTLDIAPGTSLIETAAPDGQAIILSSPNVTIRGGGREVTILRAGTPMQNMFVTTGSPAQRIVFEDVQLDGNFLASILIAVDLNYATSVVFRRCKFVRFNNGVLPGNGKDVLIEECLWDNYGQGTGTALEFSGNFERAVIRNSEFLWCSDAIVAAPPSGGQQVDLLIESNTFDLGWYTLPAIPGMTGSGMFTPGYLTDNSKDFSTLAQYSYIRVMTIRHTGSASGAGTECMQLQDPAAFFLTGGCGILEGEIVRCAGAFAVILGIQDDHTLTVERWLDDVTRQPVPPPNDGSAYTVYGVHLGKVDVVSADKHTVTLGGNPWFDLRGNPFTPPDGAHYEAIPKCNYAVNAGDPGSRRVRVLRNTFKRGYSDQISLGGDENIVAHNNISWGQDMGITLNGTAGKGHSIIHDNFIYRQGTGGIFAGKCENSDIHDNVIVGHGWIGTSFTGGMFLYGCKQTKAHNNRIDGLTLFQTRWGIVIGGTDSCDVLDNRIVNLTAGGAEISVYDPSTKDLRIRHDGAPPSHPNQPPAPAGLAPGGLYEIVGLGSPEGVHTAGVGSRYVELVPAFAPPVAVFEGHFWFKAVGTGNTGWKPII